VASKAVGELNLGGAGAGHAAAVTCKGLVGVDTVVNGALDVVHDVVGGAAHDDGGDLAGIVVLAEDGDGGVAKLVNCDLVNVTNFLRGRSNNARQGRGVDAFAQAAKIMLGGEAHSHNVVPVQKVQRQVTKLAA
jgi:hypothetical protein